VPATKLGIRLYLTILSLSNTIFIIYKLGAVSYRFTVQNWMQKADLQPADRTDPDHAAVDGPWSNSMTNDIGCTPSSERVVFWLANKSYPLVNAADPDTNRLHHVRLYSTRKQALIEISFPNSVRISSAAPVVAGDLQPLRTPIPACFTW